MSRFDRRNVSIDEVFNLPQAVGFDEHFMAEARPLVDELELK